MHAADRCRHLRAAAYGRQVGSLRSSRCFFVIFVHVFARVLLWCIMAMPCAADFIPRAAECTSYWSFRARLRDVDHLLTGEAVARPSEVRAVPAPSCGHGFACGSWTLRPSGIIEGSLQLYVYTVDSMPDSPMDVLFIAVKVAPGQLRGCLFDAESKRETGFFAASEVPWSRLACRTIRRRAVREYASLPPFSLAAHPPLRAQATPLRLEDYRVGAQSPVYYIPAYFSAAEEVAISSQLTASEHLWRSMRGRRVQECGSSLSADGKGLVAEELPPWLQSVCQRLQRDGIFPAVFPPNHVTVNEYTRTQGIAAHADGPIYAPVVAIASFYSSAAFYFYGRQPRLRKELQWDENTDTPAHKPDGPPVECLLLRPRSLLVFSGSAFREQCHEVRACADARETLPTSVPLVNGHLANAEQGQVVERGRRVSVTVRHLLDILLSPESFTFTDL
uniref:Fe2OG dioxygenase domain-containing protein n=2 Tax=Chrysotila carterae TaxID=13221 RepID=A0A7S4C1L5_CHRCT